MSVDLDLRPVLDRVTADFQYVSDRLSHLESPGQILEAIREIYQISDPFSSALLASLIIGIVCYLTSCITKNQSVVGCGIGAQKSPPHV